MTMPTITMPELQFGEVFANIDLLFEACGLTLALWAVALAAGLSGGLLVGLARISPRRWIAWPARGYVELFRNTPVLVQLIWFYYALPVLSGIQLPAFAAAALALSLNASAYCAEIYRGGIQSVAAGQCCGCCAGSSCPWRCGAWCRPSPTARSNLPRTPRSPRSSPCTN
jgi:polar amino acid transport system permease protein